MQWGALEPDRIALYHEYWRLVSAMFLHGGLLHLAINMYVLWVLGSVIEPAFGSKRFLAIYLISGLFGSVASYMFSAPDVAGVGASGAIFGLLGAWVAFNLRRRAHPMRPRSFGGHCSGSGSTSPSVSPCRGSTTSPTWAAWSAGPWRAPWWRVSARSGDQRAPSGIGGLVALLLVTLVIVALRAGSLRHRCPA